MNHKLMKQLQGMQEVLNEVPNMNHGNSNNQQSVSSDDKNEAIIKEQIIKTLTKENLIQTQKQAKLETLICV